MKAVVNTSMYIHVNENVICGSARRDGVVILSGGPYSRVIVDGFDEKIMEQLEMSFKIGVQGVSQLKKLEQLLPLSPKSEEDINP